MVLLHLWPVLRQNLMAERINFAECARLKSAAALQPKAKPADAAEKVENAKLSHSRHLSIYRGGEVEAELDRLRPFNAVFIAILVDAGDEVGHLTDAEL